MAAVFRVIDGRQMQPPEPLQLATAAIDELPVGSELLMRLYCSPSPLFDLLRRRGFRWTELVCDDGTHEIRIRHAD